MKNQECAEDAGRRAFTLVELLVAIGIIAVVSGMLVGAGQLLRAKQARDSTRTLIERVETALEEYRSTFRKWPDAVGSMPGDTDYGELADILLGLEAVQPSEVKEAWQPSGVRGDCVVDRWLNSIYVIKDGHNSPGLDIWSAGPDGQSDRDADDRYDYGDDVVNWARE